MAVQPGDVRGNGHKQPQPFGDAWGYGEGGGVAKYFVAHGEELLDALMRCKFEDTRDQVATLGLARKCIFFEDDEGLQGVIMKVVSNNSIGAEQLKLLVQAITGQPQQSNKPASSISENIRQHLPSYGRSKESNPQDKSE